VSVDRTSGDQTALGAYRIRACFDPPSADRSVGLASYRAQLVQLGLTLPSAFDLPTASGRHVWRALATPYAQGAARQNVSGTVEARAFAGIPQSLTIRTSYSRRANLYSVSGTVFEGGAPAPSARVRIVRGPTPAAVRRAGLATGGGAPTRPNGTFAAGGCLDPRYQLDAFACARRGRRPTTFVQAYASAGPRSYPRGCSLPTVARSGVTCVTATLGGFSDVASPIVRIRTR
jgi:hypothetical protein